MRNVHAPMRDNWRTFWGCVLTFFFAFNAIAQTTQVPETSQNVALEIFLYDNLAFEKHTEDLYERMFANLRPDLKYKRVSVQTDWLGRNQDEVRQALKEQLSSVLAPHERVSYLMINTHGKTIKEVDGARTTSLDYLGKVYESGVGSDFAEVFSLVKDQMTTDLRIILNSCDTFCGGKKSAAKRGVALLKYFGAANGGIYGAEVMEISEAFDHPEYFKWQYLKPSANTFLAMTLIPTVLSLPLTAPYAVDGTTLNFLLLGFGEASLLSQAIGVSVGILGSVLKPVMQFIASRYFANRGYFFALENGKLSVGQKIIKQNEILHIISTGTVSKTCRSIFAPRS